MQRAALKRFPFLRTLLVLMVGAAWVRSHWRSDIVALFVNGGRVQVVAGDRGRFIVALSNIAFDNQRSYTLRWLHMPNDQFDEVRGLIDNTVPLPTKKLGVTLGRSPDNAFGMDGASYHYVAISYAYLIAIASLWLLLGLRTFWVRRFWGMPGFCRSCGYDLRGSGDRCPECGTLVAVAGAERRPAGPENLIQSE